MTTYGPQNSQAATPLRILVEEEWIVAILPHMGLPVPLVRRCLVEVDDFHILAEVAYQVGDELGPSSRQLPLTH